MYRRVSSGIRRHGPLNLKNGSATSFNVDVDSCLRRRDCQFLDISVCRRGNGLGNGIVFGHQTRALHNRSSITSRGATVTAGDDRDIVVDDLFATLEAHRATNRAKTIRKVGNDIPAEVLAYNGWYSLALTQNDIAQDGKRTIDTVAEAPVVGSLNAPDGQHVRQQKQKAGRSGNNIPLEYQGLSIKPQPPWAPYSRSNLQRPWLTHLKEHEGHGRTRYVLLF